MVNINVIVWNTLLSVVAERTILSLIRKLKGITLWLHYFVTLVNIYKVCSLVVFRNKWIYIRKKTGKQYCIQLKNVKIKQNGHWIQLDSLKHFSKWSGWELWIVIHYYLLKCSSHLIKYMYSTYFGNRVCHASVYTMGIQGFMFFVLESKHWIM